MNRLRFMVALWAGKLCNVGIQVYLRLKNLPRRKDKKLRGGSNKSGEKACSIYPDFLSGVKGINPKKTVFITGTNGKSTTTNLIVQVLQTAGKSVAANIEGANLKEGVATVFIKNAGLLGKLKREYLILETDERSLAKIRECIPAAYICVTNMQKDQVQRNGDPDYIYQKIKAVIDGDSKEITVLVNNDEPRSCSLAQFAGRAVRFGVARNCRESVKEESISSFAPQQPAHDEQAGGSSTAAGTGITPAFGVTMPCPRCYDAIEFEYYNLANVGRFSCPACGFASEKADYLIESVNYERVDCESGNHKGSFIINGESYKLNYDEAHVLYNYALAYAVCRELGISTEAFAKACEDFITPGGRSEDFSYGDKDIHYIRMKQENPETLQSVLDYVAGKKDEKVFIAGLELVHDMTPYYSNTFYSFDCNFEPLLKSGVEKCICFGKTICWDMANRLIYAGFPKEKIEILDTDNELTVLNALGLCKSKKAYLIAPMKQYEKMFKYGKPLKKNDEKA